MLSLTWRCLSRSLSLSFSLSRSRSFSRRSLARCSTSLRARSMASFLFFQSLEPSSGTNKTSLRAQEFPLPRSRTLWNLKPKRFCLFHELNNHHTCQYYQKQHISCGIKLCVISGYVLIPHVSLTIDYWFLSKPVLHLTNSQYKSDVVRFTFIS